MIRTIELIERLREIVILVEQSHVEGKQNDGNVARDLNALRREAIKQELLRHPPTQVVSVFFSHKWATKLSRSLRPIKEEFRTRRSLIEWIHGKAFATEFTYSKLPSRSKRLFVFDLVSRVRRKYPWLNSSLVHAFAFRPTHFEASRQEQTANRSRWRGLYQTRRIAKGGKGERVLHVPSPPLKRLQRCILQLCLERATATLPACVNGCRPRLSKVDPVYGTYRNAAAHLGQAFMVNLDLKDFFPSVRVDQVIRALLRLRTPLHLRPAPFETDSYLPESPRIESVDISPLYTAFGIAAPNVGQDPEVASSRSLESGADQESGRISNPEPLLYREIENTLGVEGDEPIPGTEVSGQWQASLSSTFRRFFTGTSRGESETKLEELPWMHDAAVLIARLCTYRGRLPQGAPTSPALANLVFAENDKRIQEALGPDFVYTRYVDDLTISISPSAARRKKIRNKDNMKAHVESVVRTEITRSGFQLNERKTKVSQLADEHRVTGLRVGKDSVRLPRETLRRLRSVIYRVKRDGFVKTATSFIGGEIHASTQWNSTASQHRLDRRRLSTERLAALMIRDLCPKLRIEVPGQKWSLGGNRIARPSEVHDGNKALRDLERLLPRLWENELLAEADEGHVTVRDRHGLVVGRFRSERNIEFLLLSKRDAIACVEFWHWLRGWESSLNPKSNDRCFAQVVAAQVRLRAVREGLRIDVPVGIEEGRVVGSATVAAPEGFSLLEKEGPVVALASTVTRLFRQFYNDAMRRPLSHEALKCSLEFGTPVNTVSQFKDWIHAARMMFVDELEFLPLAGDAKNNDVFTQLRILDDYSQHLRHDGYDLVSRFIRKHIKKSHSDMADADTPKLQTTFLEMIKDGFEESDKRRREQGQSIWREKLPRNTWYPSSRIALGRDLRRLTAEFIKYRTQAVWQTTGEAVFKEAANDELAGSLNELCEPIVADTTRQVWRNLFEFGKVVSTATSDSLSGDSKTFSQEVAKRLIGQPDVSAKFAKSPEKYLYEELNSELGEAREHFDVLFLLRNRASHPEDPTKRGEWNQIQKHISRLLGRSFKSKESRSIDNELLFGPDDLQLTSLEGTEAKLRLLQGACLGLQQFRFARQHTK